jgi:hypothetical protein
MDKDKGLGMHISFRLAPTVDASPRRRYSPCALLDGVIPERALTFAHDIDTAHANVSQLSIIQAKQLLAPMLGLPPSPNPTQSSSEKTNDYPL